MKIIITSPSLNTAENVSGVSEITNFIIKNNPEHEYMHFRLGKGDNEKRGIFWLFRILAAWFRWFFLMARSKDILVHFNFALDKRSSYRDLPLMMFSRMMGKKMIIHLHGGEFLQERKPPILIKYALIKILSGKEPKIVLSTIEQEIVAEKFKATDIIVLANSIDISTAVTFSRNGMTEPVPKLLFIGRVDKNKGIEYIYQALDILKEKGLPFKFLMAGTGPEKDEYVQKFTASLNSHFEYKGVVTGKNKEDLFKESSIFLLPSLYEGLPISLIESMSFGIVPVVTNVGSIGTIVKPDVNGIFVGRKSAEEIAESIEKLINDRQMMSQMSKNAREIVFRNFDPEVYIQKLNKIYSMA